MRWQSIGLAILVLIGLVLRPTVAEASGDMLRIGVTPYLNTRTLLATHEALGRSLQESLGQDVQISTAPDYRTFYKRLQAGDYDLAISPPHYGWLAVKDLGYSALLVHTEPIRGILITAQEQPLRQVTDLRGQSIAINDRSALLAILGAISLNDVGLQEGRDYRYVETVSHSSALHAALSGKARAALINATSLHVAAPEIRKRITVWKEIATIPGQFYVAHPRLSRARQEAIRKALLVFEHSDAGRSFFSATQQGGYRLPSSADQALLDRALPETRRLLAIQAKSK